MATISGTVDTTNAGALSESVRDVVINTAPTATPIYTMGMAKGQKAKALIHEWPIHSYEDAAENAHKETADVGVSASQDVVKISSRCQLKTKGVQVSDTVRAVKTYGREDELGFKLAEAGMALKRDCEFAVVSAQASAAETSNKGALMAGLITQADSGVSDKVANSVAARALNASRINGVINNLAGQTGGVQDFKLVSNTTQLSKANDIFVTGQVNRYVDGDSKSVATGITMVRTQYGMISLMLDNFIANDTVLILDPAYVSYATLMPMETEKLAKTGTAEKWQLKEQGTICALAPNRVAAINRLTTS